MNNKQHLIGMALIIVAGTAFASGQDDGDMDHWDDRDGGYYGRGGMYGGFSEKDMVDLEGEFTLVEGEFPAIVDAAGKTSYVLIAGHVEAEDVPEEGVNIKAKAYPARLSPVHFMVTSAMVNGKEIVTTWKSWWWRRGNCYRWRGYW